MKGLFSHIASRYDRMNRLMSLSQDRRWRRLALGCATMPPKGAVLDLACGTGDFTAEMLRLHPGTDVTGLDLTPEMIEIARAKLGDGVRLISGDAQDLSMFQSGTFALIVCAFGFRNFPDKRRALAECRRVLRPGGELVVLELFRPESRMVGAFVNAWLSAIARLFARGASGEYAYLRKSVAGTVSTDEFAALAASEGFTVKCRRRFFPSATCIALSAL